MGSLTPSLPYAESRSEPRLPGSKPALLGGRTGCRAPGGQGDPAGGDRDATGGKDQIRTDLKRDKQPCERSTKLGESDFLISKL